MAIEVELKARVGEDEFEGLEKKLSLLGVFSHSFEKYDAYFAAEGGSVQAGSAVRLRREKTVQGGVEKETAIVTKKRKEIRGGMEVNEELEFAVSDSAVFEDFLRQIGMRLEIKKEKRGSAWRVVEDHLPEESEPPILAELLYLKGLGRFIELEIILQGAAAACESAACESAVSKSQRRLLNLLAELGIAPEKIEAKTYTAMLKEAAAKGSS